MSSFCSLKAVSTSNFTQIAELPNVAVAVGALIARKNRSNFYRLNNVHGNGATPLPTFLRPVAVAWLLFVVLLPSSINAVASTLYPVPSRVEYIQSLREASEGEVAERSRLMAAFYEDHPEFVKGSVSRLDDFTLTKEKLNERMAARLRPVTERFGRQIKN
jgi:hypothetical protein